MAFHGFSKTSTPTERTIRSIHVNKNPLFYTETKIKQQQRQRQQRKMTIASIFTPSSSSYLSTMAKLNGSNEERWMSKYDDLAKYCKEHGNCLVPQTYPDDPALGRWVRKQRSEYSLLRRGQVSRITPKRIELLEGLDFVWDAKVATWYSRLDDLKHYKEKHGHVNVPQSEGELGRWVRNQRMQYSYRQSGREGGEFLTEERQRLLEDLGFCWDVNDANWMAKFESLKKFKEEFGHCNVPSRYESDIVLARWVLQVRLHYKDFDEEEAEAQGGRGQKSKKRDKLTKQRIQLLDSIGFVWDPHDLFWWEQYESLKAYKAEHGSFKVPQKCEFNPRLGNWVSKQRRLCREYMNAVGSNSTTFGFSHVNVPGMNEERFNALIDIGFCSLSDLEKKEEEEEEYSMLYGPNARVDQNKLLAKPETSTKPKPPVVPFPWDEI